MACPGSAQECHSVRGIIARELDSAVAALHGHPAKLYDVKDLAAKALGHGVPQVRLRGVRAADVCLAATDEEFGQRFRAVNPILAKFDFARFGLVLAGGAAAAILSHKDAKGMLGDYDLFFGGAPTEEEVVQAITALGDHIYEARCDPTVFRSANCVTFVSLGNPSRNERFQVQIILRRHKSISELLSGFDLGSSQVAWDGQRVHLTGLGKFAMDYRMNIVCLETRRASLEERISKYMVRGYGLVMPELGGLPSGMPSGKISFRGIERRGCLCTLTCEAVAHAPTEPDEPLLYSAINYGRGAKGLRRESINLLNAGHLGGLVAGGPYSRGLDAREISLCIPDFDELMGSAIKQGMGTVDVRLSQLSWLVGPKAARQLIEEALTHTRIAKSSIDAVAAERQKELDAALPFRIENSGDIRNYGRMSAAEWYGKTWVYAE